MVYLDYSATTPIDKRVLDTYVKASSLIGNPNSLHKLGVETKKLIDASTNQISKILKVKPSEIIYTSGASEANNLAIKGIEHYENRGKVIITTSMEHSSIYGPLAYMEKHGYLVKYAPLENGIVNIKELEKMLNNDVALVTISAVNSETGVIEPIEEIGKILKNYPKTIFHSDMTQAIGKINVNLENVDLISFAPHKFFGPKGVGVLIKKENINLTPLISGGKSTTVYRSGTPAAPLIASTAKALRLVYENINEDILKIKKLNKKIRENLKNYPDTFINSPENAVPHILNVSVIGIKPETLMHALEQYDIYISTQSACATGEMSKAVFMLTQDKEKASSSVRISLSKLTTEEEVNIFLKGFEKCYQQLKN